MARHAPVTVTPKAPARPAQPPLTLVVRTREWPNGIIISPHAFSTAPPKPAPKPDNEPDTPETE